LSEFRNWQNSWRFAYHSLFRKLKWLHSGPDVFIKNCRLYRYLTPQYVFYTNHYTNQPGLHFNRELSSLDPAVLFTTEEKAVWKNLATWRNTLSWVDGDWVDLPGPAWLWPDNDTIDAAGFGFSVVQAAAHKDAFQIVLAQKLPLDDSYDRIFPSYSSLWLMEDGLSSRKVVTNFLDRQSLS
jgi:hypothetical protein